MMTFKVKYIMSIVGLIVICSLMGVNPDRSTRRDLMSSQELEAFQNHLQNYSNDTPTIGYRYRNPLPPSNLTYEVVDNVNVMLRWEEPTELVKISYHSDVPWDAYLQFSNDGYGTIFDLSDYPDHTLEYLEFHHSSWEVIDEWAYDILMIDWETGNLLSSRRDTTRVNDDWEREVPLGSVNGTARVGVFIIPLGHQANDAYPVLDFDNEMTAESIIINAENYNMIQNADGDFLMDLYIRPPAGRGGDSDVRPAPRRRVARQDERDGRRTRNLLGYNIYRDENLIDHIDGPDTLYYYDTDLEDDTYEYYVTAVYEEGESAPTNIVRVDIIADLDIIFYDDFSDYPNFVINFPPWVTIDEDGSFTRYFRDYHFPGEGNPMAWMVFNPYETAPPMNERITPHSGEKMAASFSAVEDESDKWLITPQIPLGSHSSLQFYAQSHNQEFGLERLRVGISSTDPDPDSFHFIFPEDDPYHEVLPFVWQQINVDLSDFDGQDIHIAFQNASHDAMTLWLDTVKVTSVIFPEGDGSEDNPYHIATARQLNAIRHFPDAHFVQIEDINLGVEPWNIGQGWVPLGNGDINFTGSYDGNGYAISNLLVDRFTDEDNQGFFGILDGAVIRNVALKNVYIRGNHQVGGLAAQASESIIENCYVTGELVQGVRYTGGLIQKINNTTVNNSFVAVERVIGGHNTGGLVDNSLGNSIISNCYATSSVEGSGDTAGGLVGVNAGNSSVINSYATGIVTGVQSVGGLIGINNGTVINSYWDTETSGLDISAGGEGRTTEQMTYPYDETAYVNWDFDQMWRKDRFHDLNNGYPALYWYISDTPRIASNPLPEDNATEVSVELESLSWDYREDSAYTKPLGFRVYFNDTGIFGEDDDFDWLLYEEDKVQYATSGILHDQLEYGCRYYWKVIPTTREEGVGEGFDAMNYPVWSFTAQLYHNPATAVNPYPSNDTTGISVDIEELQWDYIVDSVHVKPLGFRVYFNDTGVFGEDDDFEWVLYEEDQLTHLSTDILPEQLDYYSYYYWKVVPTTIDPGKRNDTGRKRVDGLRTGSYTRGDAENVPVWSFKTKQDTYIEDTTPILITELKRNYPNPFNPETVIEFSIKEETYAALYVYNSKGQLVRTLHNGLIPAGEHRIIWDGKDSKGEVSGSGIYFYRLQTDNYDKVSKMLLLK